MTRNGRTANIWVMAKPQKDGLLRAFSQAFHEVVAPILEQMQKDFTAMKKDIEGVKDRLDGIDRRLVRIDDRLDRVGGKFDNHERRITRLETKTGIAA